MNYKETLLFVGACLTISQDESNRTFVKQKLKTGGVNWENVVKLSTQHYVFPSLYCNLKKVNFLHFLPKELVNYMKHIADLNRDRNKKIIQQATEINQLLLTNNITPVFLKGTAFLLQGMYEDIAERMVGDIDFLVAKKHGQQTLAILQSDGYSYPNQKYISLGNFRHYPRLVKPHRINAVEVHTGMTLKKHNSLFNYKSIEGNLIKPDTCTFLSYQDQVLHTCINIQLNDYGYLYKNLALRNSYDLYLLSFKTNTLNSIKKMPQIFKYNNVFLSLSSFVFNDPNTIRFHQNKHESRYLTSVKHNLDNPKKSNKRRLRLQLIVLTKKRIIIILRAFYSKHYFTYVFQHLTDIDWYKRRFLKKWLKS